MSQESINLILGAVISLVSSIVAIVTTYTFQIQRDKRTREWKLEDDKEELAKQLISNRINDLESFSKEIAVFISTVNTELPRILHNGKRNEILDYCVKILRETITPLSNRAEHYLALSLYFNNQFLFEKFRLMIHIITELVNFMNEIIKTISDDKALDYQKIEERLKNLSILEPYSDLLHTFDAMRIDPSLLRPAPEKKSPVKHFSNKKM